MSCVKCGKNYSDTLDACPHCHYAPQVFVCPECGGVYGKADAVCANCGVALNNVNRVIADEAAVQKAVADTMKLVEEAENLAQLNEVGKTIQLLATCGDVTELANSYNAKYEEAVKAENYATACNLVANSQTIPELTRAELLLTNLGDYEDAPEKLAQCREALNGCKMSAALVVMNNAKDVAQWQNASLALREIGDFRNAPELALQCEDMVRKMNASKKKKGAIAGIVVAAVLVAIAAVAAVLLFFIPNGHYSTGTELFAQEKYTEAAQAFLEAGSFKDAALKAEEAKQMAAKKVNYEEAMNALASGNFEAAIDGLKAAIGYRDAADQLNEVGYAYGMSLLDAKDYLGAAKAFDAVGDFSDGNQQVFACGKALLEQEAYNEAVEVFNLYEGDDSAAYCTYANGRLALANGDYLGAVSLFETIPDVEDATTRIGEGYYRHGKSLLDSGNYTDAKGYFEKAGDYKGAAKMINACTLAEAEVYWKKGYLNTAKKLYNKLPEDFKYDGVSVSKRLSQLKKFSGFVKLCGKWQAKGTCKATVRQIYKRTGSWHQWDTTWSSPYDYLTITCTISDKGKVTMKGKAEYSRHTKYSSLSSLLRTTSDSASFTYKTTKTKVPSTIKINSKEKLSISGTKFTLKYDYTNKNESVNFNYKYTSTWKYSKNVEKY